MVALSGTERASPAADGDAAPDFRSVKGAIQQLLRSKKPADRIDALGELEKFPVPDAAKLAIAVGTKDDSAEVREAAYNTLGVIADNEQVEKMLLDSVEARDAPQGAGRRVDSIAWSFAGVEKRSRGS